MRLYLLLFFIVTIFCDLKSQQKNFDLQDSIVLKNNSFESVKYPRGIPSLESWVDCSGINFPLHKGLVINSNKHGAMFNIQHRAKEGNVFITLSTRGNGSYESIAQKLERPLKSGENYKVSLNVSSSENLLSQVINLGDSLVRFDALTKIELWASNEICKYEVKLAEQLIDHTLDWKIVEFYFKADAELTHLIIRAYFAEEVLHKHGNILLDKISNIYING